MNLLSQLHLQEGGLHVDINGDGVLDHVQVPPLPLQNPKMKNLILSFLSYMYFLFEIWKFRSSY